MKVDGLDKLINHLETMHQDIDEDVDYILKMNALEGQAMAVETAKVVMNKGYWTGNLAREIKVSSKEKLKYKIISNAGYSGFLEKGTRFMAPEPFMSPTYQELKKQVPKDIKQLLKG